MKLPTELEVESNNFLKLDGQALTKAIFNLLHDIWSVSSSRQEGHKQWD